MQIRKATLDDILATTRLVEKKVSDNLPIVGLTEPYLSYFYTNNYKTQVKGLFLNANETANRNSDIIFIVTDDTDNIIGYTSGGFSLDNCDYDGEVYTLFTFVDDNDFRLRQLLFQSIVSELKNIDCKSIHVEITADDLNKDFYIDNGAKFITGITNMTKPSYKTLDFGWTDIEEIKL
jgi:hypothetical protein